MLMLNAYSWLFLAVILLMIEATTTNFVTIWFSIGAVCALIVGQFNSDPIVQISVFVLVSAAMVILTKPLVNKLKTRKAAPLNADRNVGRSALVIEAIAPGEQGRVCLDGVDWSAVANVALAQGEACRVCAMNSTVLTVEPMPQTIAK